MAEGILGLANGRTSTCAVCRIGDCKVGPDRKDDVTHATPGRRTVSRRSFFTAVVAGSTLMLVTRTTASAEPAGTDGEPDQVLTAIPADSNLVILEVRGDGSVHCALPRAEIGQGLTTSVAMLIAEELDISLDKTVVSLSRGRQELIGNHYTGGSNSIQSLWEPVRSIAATARARLLRAAADRWGADVGTLRIVDGVVMAPDGRAAHFGELAVAAAAPELRFEAVDPKSEEDLTVVGTPTTRQDARAIVTGRLTYTLDLDVPDAMPVVVRRPPTINGTVASVDEAALRAMPGVIDVAVVSTGVAIMARTFGYALAAKDAAVVTWNAGTIDDESTDSIQDRLRRSTPAFTGFGGVGRPELPGETKLNVDFDFAPVSHAAMETNSAVADVRSDRADVWASMQLPNYAGQKIALTLGIPLNRVTTHVMNGGGSFGRRLYLDGPLEAAVISRAMGKPVRLMWSRVDDMRHGRARPAVHTKFDAVLARGTVISWEQRVAAVCTDFDGGFGDLATDALAPSPLISQTLFHSTLDPYSFTDSSIRTLVEVPVEMPTGSWRSVFSGTVRTAAEIMVDRIADALDTDPLELRIGAVASDRHRDVLDTLAAEGNWGADLGPGRAQGIGFHAEFGSSAGYLVEIDAQDPRAPRVRKAVIVVDVGRVVNPRSLEAQMIGCLMDGISTTLRAALHYEQGLPLEGSYSQFHYARQRDSPPDVSVVIMPPTTENPGGAGELGVPAAAAAVANAYARATDTTPTRFPILFDVDFDPFPK
ncbi:molybdopterin-dependent oxidoreductase [Rhodococcoides fascians A25f]|nr:molybdopterin-dependent oxidoreductase [Rhodococcus fascians A25f]